LDPGADRDALPPRFELVVQLTDALIAGGRVDPALKAALVEEFGDEGYDELVLTVTFASAFSKAAVAWGPPPELPVTEVPTPTPGGDVADVLI